jgi:hypothetical protein
MNSFASGDAPSLLHAIVIESSAMVSSRMPRTLAGVARLRSGDRTLHARVISLQHVFVL